MRRRNTIALVCICVWPSLSLAQSANTGANFTASTRPSSTSGFIPPDTNGAIGPSHFVETINGAFRIYNKQTGGVLESRSLDSFWQTRAGVSSATSTFDPRIQYDRTTGRWFMVSDNAANTVNSAILIAVSSTADPTGIWTGFSFDVDSSSAATARWADYPGFGISRDWVSTTHNMFPVTGSSATTTVSLLTIPKSSLLGGTTTGAQYTTAGNINNTGFTAHVSTDYRGTSADQYTLSAFNMNSGGNGFLRLNRITGSVNSPTWEGNGSFVVVTARGGVVGAPQPSGAPNIDAGDQRFSGTPVFVNGKLWAAHTVTTTSGTVNQIAWYRINPVTAALEEQGLLPTPAGLHVYYPSIAVNPNGDIVVGYSGSDASTFASAYYMVGRYNGGSGSGAVTWGSQTVAAAGASTYFEDYGTGRNRFGDYSAVTIDPADPGLFWSNQEFVSATNIWSTRATEVVPTVTGEVRWSNAPTSGSGPFDYTTGSNWFNGSTPAATDHAIFSRWSANSYQVSLPTGSGTTSTNRLSVRQTGTGTVTFNLPSNRVWDLTNAGATTPSLSVSEFQGLSNVVIIGTGTLETERTWIGGEGGGTGNLTVNGPTFNNLGDLGLGVVGASGGLSGTLSSAGVGTFTVTGGSTATVGGQTTLGNSTSGITVGANSTFVTAQLTNLSGSNPTINLSSASAVLHVNGSANSTFGGTITGTGNFQKSGAGTVTLTGNNTYSGNTTVGGGLLLANGQSGTNSGTGASAVAVNSGTLGGSGRVAGPAAGTVAVTVASGGTIRGGDPASNVANALTLGKGLAMNAGGTVGVRLITLAPDIASNNPASNSFLNIESGGATGLAGANYAIDGTGQSFVTSTTYVYRIAAGAGNQAGLNVTAPGQFTTTNFTNASAFSFTVTGTGGGEVFLTVAPIPEPATVLIIAAGARGVGGVVRRRSRNEVATAATPEAAITP